MTRPGEAKTAERLTPAERADRYEKVRKMMAAGCETVHVAERFSVSEEQARMLMREARNGQRVRE